jgi:uncharacterized membrane protein
MARGNDQVSPMTVRKIGWVVMAVLASLVAAYAVAILVVPAWAPPFLAERRAAMPLAVYAHITGSLWALAIGPWQLTRRMRERIVAHRWFGRSYVAAILVGGLGAVALAPFAETGSVARLGFGTLGVLWITFTILAVVRIRQGDRAAHRRWMIRSFALTLAAVTLRLYLPASIAAGLPFEIAYPAIAWLCWVPNLIFAEVIVLRRHSDFAIAA